MPERKQAFEIFKESNGLMNNKQIAKILGVNEKTVSSWKSLDNWVGSFISTNERVETDEREAKRQEIKNVLIELGTYSPGLDFLIEMYLDAYEDYKLLRSDKIRREVVNYLSQLGLNAKGLKKKKTVDVDKEKEIDASQTDNKLLQFRQRKMRQ